MKARPASATVTINCPFYGHALFANSLMPVRILLVDSGGNQCGLVTESRSPCIMQTIDWSACPRVKDMRIETPAGGLHIGV